MGYTAHDTDLYFVGRGIVYFDRYVDDLPTGMRDLGNAPTFEITPTVEDLPHYSSREGLRTKDKVVILSAEGTVRVILDEYDLDNLMLAFLGEKLDEHSIALFRDPEIEGHMRLVGTSAAGPPLQVDLWSVKLKPAGAVPFITNEWGQVELQADIQSDVSNHPTSPYGEINLITES